MTRGWFARAAAATAVLAVTTSSLVAASLMVTAEPAQAAPGTPGTPSAPVELYLEDFENGATTGVEEFENYVGSSGATYTADSYWLRAMKCNGFITQYDGVTANPEGYCNSAFQPGYQGNWMDVRAKTYALGLLSGNPDANRAVSSNSTGWTDDEVGGIDGTLAQPNQRQFATTQQLNFPVENRFVTFSVDTAATGCHLVQPLLRFYLRQDDGTEIPVSSSAINPCTDPQASIVTHDNIETHYGSFAANGSLLMDGPSFGIVMRNEQPETNGNDGAFDNIRVLDVTPQLDKSFSPASVPVGESSTLTLTVTNTSELAAKDGWAFTDTLPDGLVIADQPNLGGTCVADKTADAGGNTITVTNGQLAAGEVSCTITVDVTSDTPTASQPSPKSYQNCAANISNVVGMNLPGCATVSFFTVPELSITKTSTATDDSRPGETVTYTVTATNTGTQDYTDQNPAVLFDDLSGVIDDATYNNDATASVGSAPSYAEPLLSWTGPLAVGESVTLTYTVSLSGAGDRVVRNVAWEPNDPTNPTPPECPASGEGVDPTTGESCATTEQPLPALSIVKSADTATLPRAGATVNYTVVVTNDGPGAYTDAAPATATDDLSDVLDDATFNDASLTASTGTVTRDGNLLTWSGALGAGESVTIQYSVTYTAEGNHILENEACVPSNPADPGTITTFAALDCDTVTIPGAGLQQWKTATPSATPTVADSTITYTLFFSNDGEAPAEVDTIDDLTHVLDDAVVTTEPVSVDGLTVVRNGAQISITGTVAPGAVTEVTYTVTVLPDAERGDSIASNFLLTPGTTPPTDPTCEPTDAQLPDCTTTPITGLTYSKSVQASATPVVTGTELTYTITVTNTGSTPVDVNRDDNLSDVLDDAVITTAPASDNSAITLDDPSDGILEIRGTLAGGEVAHITYTVTVNAADERGNSSAANYLVTPGTPPPTECDPATEQCTVTPVQGYSVTKSADVASAAPGSVVTYTVTVTNTGDVAYTDAAPASFSDDLSAVLDDATYNGDATSGAVVSGSTLTWSGPLAVGETVTVTYSVTVNDPATGDGSLNNAVVPTGPGGECETDCGTVTPVASYTVAKEASTASALPGDVVTYMVTVTNTGNVDYTAEMPASFTDDLSAVLDDATYNGDASAGATVSGSTLTWSGALAVGETVTVTYSVTVNDPISGDQVLVNGVVPTGPGGECAPDGCTTAVPVGSYSVTKAASATEANVGDVVTYTVTVTNTGQVAYTDADPASFTDDMSAVLDDATYNGDATSGATVDGTTLTWSGPLALGETVTVTYSVTVNDPATGDGSLDNAVVPTGPGGECVGDCGTITPLASYAVSKSVDTASAAPGDVVTYTVTVTNTGDVAYTAAAPASFSDDLSAVLDDATYNGDATSGATVTDGTLSWSGALAIGETVTVTYSVTVNDPATGDGSLNNAVVPTGPGGECETDCGTVTPIASYTVSKVTDTASALPGDVVTYTVTVTNTGDVAYTAEMPASFTDNLSAVLDDATYNGDATAGATVSGSTLTWSGALAVGETVTVTYSVTVNDPISGDQVLVNGVVPTGPGGECAPDGCVTATPVGSYSVTKSASATSANVGDTVTYTVTVTNTGQVAYTDTDPASFTDDLSAVLDDATYNDDATAGAVVSGSTLTWSGALAVGETVTVTYSVTVNDPATGDGSLNNAVVPTGPGGECETDCGTVTPVASYTVSKSVDMASAAPGSVVTYTVTVTNTGDVAYTDAAPASFSDDLSAVLDDATYNGDATSGATVTDGTLSWSGALAIGETVTVTYSVTVNDPATGDGSLNNAVVPTGPGGECETDCGTVTPVASYTVSKSVDMASAAPGSVVTYTVTVTNTGDVAYTDAAPASFSDNLSAVLDDATYNGDATSGATVTDGTLNWSGALAIGETVTVTYSVTVNDPATGDGSLNNAVVPTGPGGECETDCGTVTPVASYTVAKEASTGSALPGDVVTYTVTVTNTGDVAYTDEMPASFTDDLSLVLDDATYNDDATSGAAVEDGTLSWSGPLAIGETVTVTYSVTVNDPISGDQVLVNGVVPTGPGGECAPDGCTTAVPVGSYSVAKAASATEANVGDVVTYTVTVTNTGQVAYTDAAPASFTDDMSAVLDDATYNDDATSGATVDGTTLTWSGPLALGETVTVTYSVTVNDPATGDGSLDNAVVPTGPGGECVGDCGTITPLASYTVSKSVNTASAAPGDVVTYTVTVTNTGQAAYTDAAPASFTDDLSAVLDDATYNGDATAGATVADGTLTWAGPLAVGETVTVTYSVTVNDPATGDGSLNNAVVPTGPGGECVENCGTVTPVASYTVSKAADVQNALPGDTVTYTVTVTNTGDVAYTDAAPASFSDDLSDVLDDATFNNDASAGAALSGSTLTWSGALAVGESVTVTYSVTVDSPVTGDFTLRNAVVPTGPGGECETDCGTVTPVTSLRVEKTADVQDAVPGDTVVYSISVTNTGQVAFTDAAPASFTDDLSAVLDDATYNGDVASTSGSGTAYTAPTLSWSGALGIGETVTVTYSVTVNDPATGDGIIDNTVVTPPETGGNCVEGSTDPACVVNLPTGAFTVAKSADMTSAMLGDVVTYTVTVTNTGDVAYTADEPASFTDDLSRVLDDATYNDDATSGATVTDGTLSWSGALAVGETVTVTYSVTVNDPATGDALLVNVVAPTSPGGSCVDDDGCVTSTPVGAYTTQKSVDATDAVLGGTVTYTVTVTNTGQVAYTDETPASFTDDLAAVLDDATYNDDATSGATVDEGTLSWSGPLGVGETVTVTYSVTVNDPATGDQVLTNAVVPSGPGGECVEDDDCVTETPIAGYRVLKEVSTTSADVDEVLTFTITVTNTGQVAYTDDNPASFTDDLTSTLAVADYNNDADNGAVYEAPVLSWSGALDIGESITVTYTATTREEGNIVNIVVTPQGGGANCEPGSTDPDCTTETVVEEGVPEPQASPEPTPTPTPCPDDDSTCGTPTPQAGGDGDGGLALTGGTPWIAGGVASVILVGIGLMLIARRRRASHINK